MSRRISTIHDAHQWDGSARPMSEAEAFEILSDIADEIAAAGFTFAIILDQDMEDLRDDEATRTVH